MNPNDLALMQKGDAAAKQRLVDFAFPIIQFCCWKWAPRREQEHTDIAHEVFLRVYTSILSGTFHHTRGSLDVHLRSYLATIAHNYIVGRYRRRRPDMLGDEDPSDPHVPLPSEWSLDYEELKKQLTEREQRIFLAFLNDGDKSRKDIIEEEGCSDATISRDILKIRTVISKWRNQT